MSRRPYKTRQYVYECRVCLRWHPVPTREAQAKAKKRGICMECENERRGRIEIYKKLIVLHMEDLIAKGTAVMEAERSIYRQLYRKRQRQWRWCQEQLEPAEVV